MADEKRSAACKKAWETIRANRAAGIAPASSCKTKAPEKDYTGMISRWLAPVAFDIPEPVAAAVATLEALTVATTEVPIGGPSNPVAAIEAAPAAPLAVPKAILSAPQSTIGRVAKIAPDEAPPVRRKHSSKAAPTKAAKKAAKKAARKPAAVRSMASSRSLKQVHQDAMNS